MYRLDLISAEQKANPFQWLYKDYERDYAVYVRWWWWRVVVGGGA